MTTLRGRAPKDTFNELIKIQGEPGVGLTDGLLPIGDGSGEVSPLSLSKTKVSISGSLIIDGKELPAGNEALPGEALMVAEDGSLSWEIPKAIEELPTEVTYEYDESNLPIRVVSTFINYQKVEEYIYDSHGFIVSQRTTVGDTTRVETYEYNSIGLVVRKLSSLV